MGPQNRANARLSRRAPPPGTREREAGELPVEVAIVQSTTTPLYVRTWFSPDATTLRVRVSEEPIAVAAVVAATEVTRVGSSWRLTSPYSESALRHDAILRAARARLEPLGYPLDSPPTKGSKPKPSPAASLSGTQEACRDTAADARQALAASPHEQVRPLYFSVLRAAGDCFRGFADRQAAVATYQDALAVLPDHPERVFRLGDARFRVGYDLKEIVQVIETLVLLSEPGQAREANALQLDRWRKLAVARAQTLRQWRIAAEQSESP